MLVLGFGIGSLILAFVWSFSFIICLFLSRTKGPPAAFGMTLLAAAITAALIFWPRGGLRIADLTSRPFDPIFIPRIALLVLLSVICLALLLNLFKTILFTRLTVSPVEHRHVTIDYNNRLAPFPR
ncbi:hypothetical protein PMAYCL1PPCAC_30774 [Pristionchus mayeri]|uniref:Transmembrane protein 218 N-terminal domain-containing protein n=1 Tax=Pristionchus mayeri TaxID=1317129 RepID=A0AAN5DEY7_9BILA|nr:hypothetical protein PMAYCL1PPCAC_30774 [Pristionchus mayeri]